MLNFNASSLKALLKKAMGCSNPLLFFYKRTIATMCLDANEKIIKSLVKYGLISTSAFVNACLT